MSLPTNPFFPAEVSAAIARLNLHKEPGYDFISGKVLRELPPAAVALLTNIFNDIFRLSYYPLLWKFAQIIMVPKTGKPSHEVASYRPINLHSLFLPRSFRKSSCSDSIPKWTFPNSIPATKLAFYLAIPLYSRRIEQSMRL